MKSLTFMLHLHVNVDILLQIYLVSQSFFFHVVCESAMQHYY